MNALSFFLVRIYRKNYHGNENVLKARFSDAEFFIKEDRKKLEDRIGSLKEIVF